MKGEGAFLLAGQTDKQGGGVSKYFAESANGKHSRAGKNQQDGRAVLAQQVRPQGPANSMFEQH